MFAWGSRYLVHGNACLTLTGPPPRRLRLVLPAGGWDPPASIELIEGRTPPYSIDGSGGEIALSMMVRDNPASRAAALLLRDSGRDQLVERAGHCYGWRSRLVPLDASWSEFRIDGSIAVHEAEPARDAILELVHRQASSPDMEALATALAHRIRDWSMADTAEGAIDHVAASSLLGRRVETREEEITRLSAVESAEVSAALEEGLANAILLQPSHLTAPKGFPFIDVTSWDDEPLKDVSSGTGKSFRSNETIGSRPCDARPTRSPGPSTAVTPSRSGSATACSHLSGGTAAWP